MISVNTLLERLNKVLSTCSCFVVGLTGLEGIDAVLVMPSMGSRTMSLVAWFRPIGLMPLFSTMRV
jgi:hypothetical protein